MKNEPMFIDMGEFKKLGVTDSLELPPVFRTVTTEPSYLYITKIGLPYKKSIKMEGLLTYFGITLGSLNLRVSTETGEVTYDAG